MPEIRKVTVIGSGTMGSGIAAQVANADIPVTLIDLPSKDGNRNEIAFNAKERILNSRPPLLIERKKADLITIGNIEDNFDCVSDSDWIVEAVVERLDIKKNLYEKIAKVRKSNSIISSNTSTIPLKVLSEDMSEDLKKDFCITHFFNPVRYMRLLEIVQESFNDQKKISLLKSFCDENLGKGVIVCNDTPGFLGNRIGVYAMQVAMTEAFRLGLTVEEADAVFGRPMGIPKTGVFALYDLIGLDLMSDVLKSFRKELQPGDALYELSEENEFLKQLINKGYTGRKGKGGFYRMNKEGENKFLEGINLKNNQYSRSTRVDFDQNETGPDALENSIRKILCNEKSDKLYQYAWNVFSKIILYASSIMPSVTSDPSDIDRAMRLGFNWRLGPFQILDVIGIDTFSEKVGHRNLTNYLKELHAHSKSKKIYISNQLLILKGSKIVEKEISNHDSLDYIKRMFKPVKSNSSASLWHYPNSSCLILEFHTKANTLDAETMDIYEQSIAKCVDKEKGLIVYNEDMNFSAGVNLNLFYEHAQNKDWSKIEKLLNRFQYVCSLAKHSPIPVITVPTGLAIGGGFEVVVQSNGRVSHSNCVLGLVESLVGLVPAGGGCKELLWLWSLTRQSKKDPHFAPLKVFEIIGYAITSSSPLEAIPLKFLFEEDKMVSNRDRLLKISRDTVCNALNNYSSPERASFKLPGEEVFSKMLAILEKLRSEEKILDHGYETGKQLAYILSGGNTNLNKTLNEEDLFALEREAFLKLIQTKETQERIAFTLKHGKPLKN